MIKAMSGGVYRRVKAISVSAVAAMFNLVTETGAMFVTETGSFIVTQ